MRKLIIFSISLLLFSSSWGQEFGGNPPSLKWKQISSDTARIIFPAGLDSQANRVASIVHYLAQQQPVSLGNKLKKINIVLQNQTIIPNGYVQLGPYRSEFYMNPAMNNFDQGSVSWGDQLALHEYRHVQQFNNFNNGLSRLMHTLFGEDGYALAINASIPDWFYEGDAVYQETVLTKQGRGRLPLFLNEYPSLWQAGKKYSWMKLRNGSLKDYVPNHYNLGYLLVNYGREKYGTDFWTKVTQDASAFKGLFYPFQKAVTKYSGKDFNTFRNDAFDFYKKQTERVSLTREDYLEPVTKTYVTNYLFPYEIGKDSLVYMKTSYRHRPAFYIRDTEGEHRLKVRDISIDEQFSYRNGKIVYAAYETDPRWGWRNYSVIKVLDVKTKQEKKLTTRSKYFTPDISADGSKIAAVQVSTSGKTEIHILDAANGTVIKSIQSPDINLFTDPRFWGNEKLISPARLPNGEMTLTEIDIASGDIKQLLPPSFNVVGYPSVTDSMVYFTASYNGNDDVFGLRFQDGKLFRLTEGPLGNYFVNAGSNKFTWSSFTADGYQLVQKSTDKVLMNPVNENSIRSLVSPNLSKGDPLGMLPGQYVPDRNFAVKNYKKGTGLINFHSWRPYYEDPIFTFSIYGENVLNTLQTEVYYLYNQSDKTNAAGFTTTYSALFPWLTGGMEYTFDRQSQSGRQWSQLDSRIGLVIPLSYVSGKTYKNFTLSNYYVLRNEFNKGPYKDTLGNTFFSYLSHSISWTEQVQRAVQHIYPRFAYSLTAAHRYPVNLYKGYQFYSAASLYLPGFHSTHNIVFSAAFQQRDTTRLLFGNRFANARGYADYYGTNAGSRQWRLSVNYHLPLFYPDWGFGNILYLQRVRANLFYDYQRLFSNNKRFTLDLRSAGVELYVDTKWWNQYPLTFGIRISQLLDDDPLAAFAKGGTKIEFILPVSIIPR
ncbi:MAG: hypothetical protein H6549_11925 [Chitinophagales bacterium]|nr:hypothetical protein [Chitinophagales bacterium]